MPRRKRTQQSEPPSIDDILAGRVDNDTFFDIDDLPVDAPAIAKPFVPMPLSQVISGEGDLDSHGDVGAAADEALMRFDPVPENVPLPRRARRQPAQLPTMEEIYNSLRDDPFAAFNFILSQEQIEFEERQKRRQREGLPPSPELQWQIDKRKKHIREGRNLSEFNDPEAELRNSLMDKPDELRDFDLRRELREVNEEMKERRALRLPMLERHVRQRRLLERQLRLPISDDSRSKRPVNENIKNVIRTPAIDPLFALVKGALDGISQTTDDEVTTTFAAPVIATRAFNRTNDDQRFIDRFRDEFNREITRQNLLKEQAQRQQPLAFGLGKGVGQVAIAPISTLGLAARTAVEGLKRLTPKGEPDISVGEVERIRTRIGNTRAKAGGELDRELKTLQRNLTRDDGSPQTSKLFIKTVLQNIDDRRRLPFGDPNAISPATHRNLRPLLTQLKKKAQ